LPSVTNSRFCNRTRRVTCASTAATGCCGFFVVPILVRLAARYLLRPRKPPSQTWRTFLTNPLAQTVSIDFFTVPTATLRILFVFVALSHERRRVVHFGVTEHPTQKWTMQQMLEAFPWDEAPRYVLRDRDTI
jgi:putative transposase